VDVRNHVLDRGRDPPTKGTTLGLSGALKNIWIQCCSDCCSKQNQ